VRCTDILLVEHCRFYFLLRPQEEAFEEGQKYKEGKYIIEKAKMEKVRFVEHFTI